MKKGSKFIPYYVNETFFEKWSHDMAYILGFIVADGNVSSDGTYIKIEVSPKDTDILEFIRDKITPGYQLKQSRKSEIRWYPSNKKLRMSLIKLGVIPNKTGKEILPPNIPEEFLYTFIRGYFDGDGCIAHNGMSIICSSKSILDSLKDITNLGTVSKYGKYYYWNIRKKKELKIIFEKIYNSFGSFFLKRKWDKFNSIVNFKQTSFGDFTQIEKDFLVNNYKNKTVLQMSIELGRKPTSICRILKFLNIRRKGALFVE